MKTTKQGTTITFEVSPDERNILIEGSVNKQPSGLERNMLLEIAQVFHLHHHVEALVKDAPAYEK